MDARSAAARISRRTAFKIGLAGMAGLSAQVRAAPPAERPNILWLVSEDNNPFIGAYGDRLARTPNLDALAKRGVLFRNFYSNAPVCAPSRFTILTGVHSQSCAPANHMRAVAPLPSELRTYPEYLRSAGYYCTNSDKTDYNCDVDPARIWNDSSPNAHWRGRPDGAPFMAVFNYMTTHEMMLFRRTEGAVAPGEVRVPAYLPDTPDIRGDFASYYNLMAKMDAQIAQRLSDLAADGLTDDTIVFYYSDNGGVLPRSKRYCFDEGLRCAMIVYVPPKWRHLVPADPGGVISAPVSQVDLAPTLLSLAGIAKPPQMQGTAFMGRLAGSPQRHAFGMRNRMDERIDFVRTVTDGRFRYIRNYMPHRPWGMHGGFEWQAKGYQDWERQFLAGTLTPVQSRFFGPKPFEELYDLHADRDEIANRVADPALAPKLREFRQSLDAHMLEIVDNGFIPEGSALEGYRQSRQEAAYPLRKIMALAQAAARGEARKLPLFRASLADGNEAVRYWAATGLLILKDQASPARADLARAASSDPSPQVRVVAAEALSHMGDLAGGLASLKDLAAADHTWQVRLSALNALTALGERARPALPVIRQAASEKQEYLRRAAAYLQAVLEGTYDPSRQSVGVGAA